MSPRKPRAPTTCLQPVSFHGLARSLARLPCVPGCHGNHCKQDARLQLLRYPPRPAHSNKPKVHFRSHCHDIQLRKQGRSAAAYAFPSVQFHWQFASKASSIAHCGPPSMHVLSRFLRSSQEGREGAPSRRFGPPSPSIMLLVRILEDDSNLLSVGASSLARGGGSSGYSTPVVLSRRSQSFARFV